VWNDEVTNNHPQFTHELLSNCCRIRVELPLLAPLTSTEFSVTQKRGIENPSPLGEVMAVDVEMLWFEAMDAQDEGDRDEMCRLSDDILATDPTHGDAWWMRAKLELPSEGHPTLLQVSRCLRSCRKAVEFEPDNRLAWWRGGQILVEELGMLEEALEWWESKRRISPGDPEPLIEQVAILADLGQYKEAAVRLELLNRQAGDPLLTDQMIRAARLSSIVRKAAQREEKKLFKPWDSEHEGWKDIEFQKKRKPANDQMTFLMLAGPIVMAEVLLWNSFEFTGSPIIPMIAGFLLVLATVLVGVRWSKALTMRMNRPAFNAVRAVDVEMSSGRKCFPDAWRGEKLYLTLLKFRTPAFRQRLETIVESDEPLPKSWKPRIPEMTEEYFPYSEEE